MRNGIVDDAQFERYAEVRIMFVCFHSKVCNSIPKFASFLFWLWNLTWTTRDFQEVCIINPFCLSSRYCVTKFKANLKELCLDATDDSPFCNTSVEELESRQGYGFALRHALHECVSTPYVMVRFLFAYNVLSIIIIRRQ